MTQCSCCCARECSAALLYSCCRPLAAAVQGHGSQLRRRKALRPCPRSQTHRVQSLQTLIFLPIHPSPSRRPCAQRHRAPAHLQDQGGGVCAHVIVDARPLLLPPALRVSQCCAAGLLAAAAGPRLPPASRSAAAHPSPTHTPRNPPPRSCPPGPPQPPSSRRLRRARP